MNKIVDKCLLRGDTFMLESYLTQGRFIYSTCGLFTKHCEKIQEFRKTGNLKQIYKFVSLMMQHILIVKIWLKNYF